MKIMDVGMAIEAMTSKGLTDEGKAFVNNLYQCWKEYGMEYHFEDLKDLENEIARLMDEAARSKREAEMYKAQTESQGGACSELKALYDDLLNRYVEALERGGKHETDEVAKAVEKAPTIEAEPVKRGRWVGNDRHKSCSCCSQTYCIPDGQKGTLDMSAYHYCPNCGAKMEE